MRTKSLLGTAVAAVLLASYLTLAGPSGHAVPIPGGQATTLFIPGADGVRLNAVITAPPDIATHKSPLVLQPSGWGMPAMGSLGSAYRLSTGESFISVEYTARGMYLSEGEVAMLGPKDAEDASAVIDWAIANLNADPDRIAIAGGSYGAGMSLIAAAHDPRIKAIVADSPPTDLGDALAPNGTPKTGGPIALALAGAATNRFSPDLVDRGLQMILNNNAAALEGLPNEHLLAEAIPKLNANGTAVFLAHDWQDSLLPSGLAFSLFDQLTGPKMLYMQAGDHSTGGGTGQIMGWPNPVWDAGIRWLDHHVNGADNGIDQQAPVQLSPANGGLGAPYTGFPSVSAALAAVREFPLSAPATATMGADGTQAWSQSLNSGPTIAVAAVPYVSGVVAQLGIPPAIPLAGVDRNLAAVWQTTPFPEGGRVAGTTRIALTVEPSSPDLTLIGILYDEAPDGTGKEITYAPLTRRGLTPNEPNDIAWDLAPTYWNLAPGHRLTLTVTSQDPVPFTSATPMGSVITFCSPSTVLIPVHAG
ncbi:CocE/NonD family hydrolase [Nocardia sp. NPDC127579]|uniref:CocE/NonD family hydrolase n=1 Tax=Nocardia sp. NPDC127579 TaxID=3345402 RepID=UPI003632C482